ncbi:MAG: hypothetical protein KBI44_16405 [Thermoanaerobaculia bacterium]|jgi:hypothetical protein|nr:hypothetical protein [Thermoanaerobaculia bacterium]
MATETSDPGGRPPRGKRSRGTHLRRLPPDPAENSVAVGEETFQWEQRHGWGTNAEGENRGPSYSVWLLRHQTRELILDLPYALFFQKTPEPEKLAEVLQRAIAYAIDCGWNPDSRGRRFRLEVPESEVLDLTDARKRP